MTFIASQRKLLGHLDYLIQIKESGATFAPINVEIDLSNRCSLGCEWCHFAYTHTRGPLAGKVAKPTGSVAGGDLMDTDLAFQIVEQLAAAGVRSITWTGGGEPTLHPDFNEIIERTAATGISQGIYTHGGHINETRAALLKKHLTFVYVSVDAAEPVAYKAAKGVDRFAKVMDNMRLLRAAEGDATIGYGYLVTKDNWNAGYDAISRAAAVQADYIQFRPAIQYEQDEPGQPAEDVSWVDSAVHSLLDLKRRYSSHVEVDIERFRMYQKWTGHGYHRCWWSTLQTCITPNGKVWACVNKREHPNAEIGDLSVEPFADIWGRHTAVDVTSDCRVMCRGHLSNLALDEIVAPQTHGDFV